MSNTVINTNVMALNSHRALTSVGLRQARSSERLSTGMRINRASDDAAGLAISEKMRAQIRGLDQAERNSQDGISLVQIAEGAFQEMHNVTQRMRELTVQAANDTLDDEDRAAIELELIALVDELENIVERTEFNGISLFDHDPIIENILAPNHTINIQNGANAGESLGIQLPNLRTPVMYVGLPEFEASDFDPGNPATWPNTSMSVFTVMVQYFQGNGQFEDFEMGGHAENTARLTLIDATLQDLSTFRAGLGATQNRLEHTINNLQIASENTSAAESRIRDTDMAREMMSHTQANILQQAAVSMLAQANQAPQAVLQLLQ